MGEILRCNVVKGDNFDNFETPWSSLLTFSSSNAFRTDKIFMYQLTYFLIVVKATMALLSKKKRPSVYTIKTIPPSQSYKFNLEFLIVIKMVQILAWEKKSEWNGIGIGQEGMVENGVYEMSRENELILHGYAHFLQAALLAAQNSSCETQFSICRIFSDGSQFDASIPTQSPFGHQKKSLRYQPNHRLRKRKLPHLCVPRNGIHGSYRLPKPANNQAKNRLKSICQRIQRLIKAQ